MTKKIFNREFNRYLGIWTTAAFLLGASTALGQENPGWSERYVKGEHATHAEPDGWLPAVGLGFGHLDQSGSSTADGDAFNFRVLSSWYLTNSNWIADAGVGIHRQYFDNVNSDATVGLLQLGGRYQLNRLWAIGPVVDLLFGNGDDFGSTDDNTTALVGAIVTREFAIPNDQMLRLGAKFSGEVGESGQTSSWLGISLDWGFGAKSPATRAVSAL